MCSYVYVYVYLGVRLCVCVFVVCVCRVSVYQSICHSICMCASVSLFAFVLTSVFQLTHVGKSFFGFFLSLSYSLSDFILFVGL